jgi:Domain of unknown function (DUF4177)
MKPSKSVETIHGYTTGADLAGGSGVAATSRRTPMTPSADETYEYHIVSVGWNGSRKRQQALNKLGAEGWELVTSSPAGIGYTHLHLRRLKRPGQVPPPERPRLSPVIKMGYLIIAGLFVLCMLITPLISAPK